VDHLNSPASPGDGIAKSHFEVESFDLGHVEYGILPTAVLPSILFMADTESALEWMRRTLTYTQDTSEVANDILAKIEAGEDLRLRACSGQFVAGKLYSNILLRPPLMGRVLFCISSRLPISDEAGSRESPGGCFNFRCMILCSIASDVVCSVYTSNGLLVEHELSQKSQWTFYPLSIASLPVEQSLSHISW